MSILTYFDGSRHSQGALQYAAWASTRLQAPVELVYLVEPSASDPSFQLDLEAYGILASREEIYFGSRSWADDADARNEETGRELLQAAAQRLRELGAVSVRTRVVHDDMADYAARHGGEHDLAIFGKRGLDTSLRSKRIGANTSQAIRSLTGAALIATAEYHPINRALIAYDAWSDGGTLTRWVIDSPLLHAAELTLVSCTTDPHGQMHVHDAERHMEAAGLTVSSRTIAGDPNDMIPKELESGHHDLLVIGSHEPSLLQAILRQSTTVRLLSQSLKPTLVVRLR